MKTFCLTDPGKVRDHNEDSYTEASWNAMQEKLTAAKDALTKKKSQDAVTKAASELLGE